MHAVVIMEQIQMWVRPRSQLTAPVVIIPAAQKMKKSSTGAEDAGSSSSGALEYEELAVQYYARAKKSRGDLQFVNSHEEEEEMEDLLWNNVYELDMDLVDDETTPTIVGDETAGSAGQMLFSCFADEEGYYDMLTFEPHHSPPDVRSPQLEDPSPDIGISPYDSNTGTFTANSPDNSYLCRLKGQLENMFGPHEEYGGAGDINTAAYGSIDQNAKGCDVDSEDSDEEVYREMLGN
eukprot:Nk52_evm1s2505 gene=Nk52_evmTU1s2505